MALWKRIVLVYLLVSLVVTFFALLSSDEDQRYAQSRYPYLAQRIPGLRYFPGWAQSDEAPWYFQEYQVDKVGFHVGFSTNSVKVDVVRAGTTDTQVSLFVYLYDVNGNLIDWCQPVKPHMYFPGGRFSRKEKFQRVGGPQPVFYCLYQPPTATPRPVPVRPSPAVTSPVPVASPPTAEPTHDPVMACIKAQRFVRARLKAPRTAKFPWPSAEYVDDLGSQRYRVISYVDAQNSFGAMLRSNYICELQYVGNGQWEEISCEILEP